MPRLTPGPADLRMPVLGLAAWASALLATLGPGASLVAGTAALGALVLALRAGRRAVAATLVAVLLTGGAVAVATLARDRSVGTGPVASLAQEGAAVEVLGVVVSDPRPVTSAFGSEGVVVRLSVREVVGRGLEHRVRSPVLVLADPSWDGVALGSLVHATGALAVPQGRDLAAVLRASGAPEVRAPPDVWWRGAAAVRASLREAVDHRPPDQRALVPALVVGDDAELPEQLEADFRTTGLTHLTAVSGTNLTLLLAFLLVAARWCGVRGRWLHLVMAVGIVGFVLLARTEPSVLRAAAMGVVGLLGLRRNGRARGLRALSVAVVVLLLVQPSLALTPGFALSVLATAGIVVLAPGWRDQLARWLPAWLAEAVAVPAAAQLACTPVVAALSGEVSLVAVVANLLVAPAVGPATVLGLAAGLLGVVPVLGPPPAALLGTVAAWCVGWISAVAARGADLPVAALGWGTSPLALAVLTGLCLLLALVAAPVLRRPLATVAVAVAAVLVVVGLDLPGPWGRVDDGWLVAACDVGQGDAVVLRAGPSSGVVVDTGPDPAAVDDCLDRLGVERVPLLVLTHFHADHVAGVGGVLSGRGTGEVWTTPLLDPEDGAERALGTVREAGLVPVVPPTSARRFGDVTVQALWPAPGPPPAAPGDGTAANDASVVLLAVVGGLRVLLTGDVEPPAQGALARVTAGLDVDVLKVPHHGSRYQDLAWLSALRPEVALVSAGADNDYGHPAPDLLAHLARDGVDVGRTDEQGTLLVTAEDGEARVRGSG